MKRIDILGILNRELAKTRVHGAVARKVVQAIKHIDRAAKEDAVLTLVDNLDILYPIFPIVATTLKSCFAELSRAVQDAVCRAIRDRIMRGSFVLSTDLHAAFAVRILGEKKSPENVEAIVSLHTRLSSPIVRRDVLIAMARWGEFPWLSDQMNSYQGMSSWERRAFIIASYMLSDAGDAWRKRNKRNFDSLEMIVRDWSAGRVANPDWMIPL